MLRNGRGRGRPQGSPPIDSTTPALTMTTPLSARRSHCKGGRGADAGWRPLRSPSSSNLWEPGHFQVVTSISSTPTPLNRRQTGIIIRVLGEIEGFVEVAHVFVAVAR